LNTGRKLVRGGLAPAMQSFQRAPSHASDAAELLLMRSANRNLHKMLHVFNAESSDAQLVVQG
jgi:hypothetical protein